MNAARDPFADDVLGRLIASNQDYQRSHGHYIVPLSERLLAERAARVRADEALAEILQALTSYLTDGIGLSDLLGDIEVIAREALAGEDETVAY